MIRRILVAITMAAWAVGSPACSEDEAPASPPATTPDAAAPAAPPVALVSLADLRASVPDFPGWTRGEMAAQEDAAPQRSAHVGVTFTRGREKLELEIADTGGAPRAIESLEHIAGSSTNRKVDNGYFKGTMVGRFPAVESWNTVEKIGEVSVLIQRRFIIHVAGSGIKDAAPMRALAHAVDTSRLR